MKREDWFPTPIWVEKDLFDESKLNEILKFVNYIKKHDNGRVVSNVGGWQSNVLNQENYIQHNVSFLYDVLFEKANEAFSTFLSPLTLTSSSSWININSKGDWNHPHIHPLNYFSCVFYLTGGNDITFFRPSGEMDFFLKFVLHSEDKTNKNYSNVTYEYVKYKPQRNMVIFFPAFLKHSVEVNTFDDERISIAFNFG